MAREAAHVKLVDDGLREGAVERPIALPVVPVGSATTLFIATAALLPGLLAARRS